MFGRNLSSNVPVRAFAATLLILVVMLLSACNADIGVVATPLSADLINPAYFEEANRAGLGRVVLLPPSPDSSLGFLGPRVSGGTRLLLMPDVEEEVSLPAAGEQFRLSLGGTGGGGIEEQIILHTRVAAFRRLGEAVVAYFRNKGVEEPEGSAETITVRLFSLRGEEERESEMEALLDPLRRELPSSALSVESYAPGFNIAPVQQRVREIPPGDPVLIFLGDSGGELLPLAASTPRLVVGEALFLPPGGSVAEELGDDGAYLLGLFPSSLFQAVLSGRAGELEAELHRYDRRALTAGFGQ